MKHVALVPALFTLLLAGAVSAQVYYPSYPNYSQTGSVSAYTGGTTSGLSAQAGCVILTGDLSYGSRSEEVKKLQRFLVSQNYPGGGDWMITGYFGNATVQAVRNFQQSAGLSSTGFVDSLTRSAIQLRTCGGLGAGLFDGSYLGNYPTYGSTPAYPYAPGADSYQYSSPNYGAPSYAPAPPTYPTYPVLTTPWGLSPIINSLSLESGGQGTVVTVYGANFDVYGTSVRFGPTSIVPAINPTQTQFTFTVPNVPSGSYPVTVTTSRGISNSVSFNVIIGTAPCGYGYPYPCGQIGLSSLNPNSGAAGTPITARGSGFSTLGNTVYFGGAVVPNLPSLDGRTITFTVPHQTGSYGVQQVPNTYPVSVRNSQGQTSNTLNFTVTSYGGGGSGVAPVISSVTGPNALPAGAQGTWTVTLHAPVGTYVTTSVRWGDETLYASAAGAPQSTYVSGQQQVIFTHTYQSVGTYTPVFTVTGPGGSNIASATVNVTAGGGYGGYSGALSLTSINPNSARVGALVTLHGSGFTPSGNDVHFGVGGTRNLSSNGTTISFLVPVWISPCDFIESGYVCGAPATQVMPGTYPVHVTNSSGTTNVINFTVTP